MIWLQTQLLEEDKMFVLGLHQLRVDSEKKKIQIMSTFVATKKIDEFNKST